MAKKKIGSGEQNNLHLVDPRLRKRAKYKYMIPIVAPIIMLIIMYAFWQIKLLVGYTKLPNVTLSIALKKLTLGGPFAIGSFYLWYFIITSSIIFILLGINYIQNWSLRKKYTDRVDMTLHGDARFQTIPELFLNFLPVPESKAHELNINGDIVCSMIIRTDEDVISKITEYARLFHNDEFKHTEEYKRIVKSKTQKKKENVKKETKDQATTQEVTTTTEINATTTTQTKVEKVTSSKKKSKNSKSTIQEKAKKEKKIVAYQNSRALEISKIFEREKIEFTYDASGTKVIRPLLEDDQSWETIYFFAYKGPHAAIVGGTGSGKSQYLILTAIKLKARSKNKHSMIISDVKGELLTETGQFLKSNGFIVKAINFVNEKNTCEWNPLKPIVDNWKLSFDPTVNENDQSVYEGKVDSLIKEIAESIFASSSSKGDATWIKKAQNMFEGVVWLYLEEFKAHKLNLPWKGKVVIDENKLNLAAMANFASITQEELGTFYGLIRDPNDKNGQRWVHNNKNEWKPKVKELINRRSYSSLSPSYIQTAPQTASSAMMSFEDKMQAFRETNVKSVVSNEGIDLRDIGFEQTAIFLVIPDQKPQYNFLASIFVHQAHIALVDAATKPIDPKEAERMSKRYDIPIKQIQNANKKKSLPITVNFILDEFGNFPNIPGIMSILTVGRSRNINATIALQSFAQLNKNYDPDTSKTILGNVHVLIYLSSQDLHTAEEISKKIGNKTVTESKGSTSTGADGNMSESDSIDQKAIPLIRPEDLLRMKQATGVTVVQNQFPVFGTFVPDWWMEYPDKSDLVFSNNVMSGKKWNYKHGWLLDKQFEKPDSEVLPSSQFDEDEEDEDEYIDREEQRGGLTQEEIEALEGQAEHEHFIQEQEQKEIDDREEERPKEIKQQIAERRSNEEHYSPPGQRSLKGIIDRLSRAANLNQSQTKK